jgi:hypothetical protein
MLATIIITMQITGKPELGGGGGQEGQLPLLPFSRRGKGGRSALWFIKYYLINHISSDAFWEKSWAVILNVTWLSAFAFIGKLTHYCRFISLPGSIEMPFGVRLPPPPSFLSFRRPWQIMAFYTIPDIDIYPYSGWKRTYGMCNFQKLSKTTSLHCNNRSENSVPIKGRDICVFQVATAHGKLSAWYSINVA